MKNKILFIMLFMEISVLAGCGSMSYADERVDFEEQSKVEIEVKTEVEIEVKTEVET